MAGGPGAYLIGDEEKKELLEVIDSKYLFRYGAADDRNYKHKVVSFEKELSGYLGTEYTVATSSGTGALMCCLSALNISGGDEVLVPGYTFIASISSIILSNATPVLVEVDESLTMDPRDIEKKITKKTKAIMPVHMLGNPCKMDEIKSIAEKYNLYIIEDCCQAFGASYKGLKCGNYGDIAAYSLNIFKTITAGDGGAVATSSYNLYERAFGFHDQGHKPSRMGVEVGNRNIVGMNLRMNELTGAVSLAQLKKLDMILKLLRRNKARFKRGLKTSPHYAFRVINDEKGECATLLTLIFKTKELAEKVGGELGIKPLSYSGWHVYNNMEQILVHESLSKNILPQTDDILSRSINISVGVVDSGLGAGFGVNINSTDKEIDEAAKRLSCVIQNSVGGKS